MTKQEFINKYIYGIGNDALTDNQEAIDMSNDLDKYVTEQLRQYNVVGRSEQLPTIDDVINAVKKQLNDNGYRTE